LLVNKTDFVDINAIKMLTKIRKRV